MATLKRAGEALVNEDKHLRTKVDQAAAAARFRADRLESINPVIVDGFLDALAQGQGWILRPGPAQGIRRMQSSHPLPAALGGGFSRQVAADCSVVQQARADGAAGLDEVIVLGPTEDAFAELVELAIETGRPEAGEHGRVPSRVPAAAGDDRIRIPRAGRGYPHQRAARPDPVDQDNLILDGRHRWRACQELGIQYRPRKRGRRARRPGRLDEETSRLGRGSVKSDSQGAD